MRNKLLFSLSVTFLSAVPTLAFAETPVTLNQPDNGFYEGANPEWANLHATDGNADHRVYHRDAEEARRRWYAEHQSEAGTVAYSRALRLFLQERNMKHRQFHTAPVTPVNP